MDTISGRGPRGVMAGAFSAFGAFAELKAGDDSQTACTL
jgi:hypothetical protein